MTVAPTQEDMMQSEENAVGQSATWEGVTEEEVVLTAETELLLEPTPDGDAEAVSVEQTPLPVVNGWQDDPAMPWWLVMDGDLSTHWSATVEDAAEKAETGFDLGAVVPLSHIAWHPTWPMQGVMEIQLSNDGVTWYRLTTIEMNQQFPDQWADIPVNAYARYVNLVFTQPSGAGSVGSIGELELWEDRSASARPLEWLPLIEPEPTPAPSSPTVEPKDPSLQEVPVVEE